MQAGVKRADNPETPEADEPCRFDLREYSCFPYPPPENQGNSVTCVVHSFAMALYCAERMYEKQAEINSDNTIYYPDLSSVFKSALRDSPDKKRGVSFEAVAEGLEELYGHRLSHLRATYVTIPNSTQEARKCLVRGLPLIVGYQVDAEIDRFHRDANVCGLYGYMLPRFDKYSRSISGHAVLVLGYDFRVQSFIARNSWGREWGVDGHFLIPFQTFADPDACTDIWTLRVESAENNA